MMTGTQSSGTDANAPKSRTVPWAGAIAGALVGAVGGTLNTSLLHGSLSSGVLIGAVYGVVFGLFFVERCSSPGAGLIWGWHMRFFFGC